MLSPTLPRARCARTLAALSLLTLLALSAGRLNAQPPAPAKKVLSFADYDIWKSATGVSLSRDGKHVAYIVGAENSDGEAVVRNVATGKEFRFARGATSAFGGPVPRFTPDGKRVLLPLSPTKGELDKAKAEKKRAEDFPKSAVVLIDLADGKEVDRLVGVSSFLVAGDGAGFLVYRKGGAPDVDPKGPPGKGPVGPAGVSRPSAPADLYVRDLTGTVDRTISDVTEYSLTTDEKALVYVTSGKVAAKNGVYVLNPRFGTAPTAIKAGPGRYSGLTWDEKQSKLAFFYDDSNVPPANLAPPPHLPGEKPGTPAPLPPSSTPAPKWRVFVWERNGKAVTTPAKGPPVKLPLAPAGPGPGAILAPVIDANPPVPTDLTEVFGPDTPGMRKGWSLSTGSLSFSADGTKLYVNTAPPRPATPQATSDDIQLDIWHWKDADIQPMQKLNAGQDRTRTYSAVVLLDSKQFRHLAEDGVTVQPGGAGDWVVTTDVRKYRHMTGYAYPLPADYALVNVRTGQTKPVPTAPGSGVNLTPDGKWLVGFDGKDWFSVSVPDGKKTNLTAKVGVKFFNEDFDMPMVTPPYGAGGVTSDGKFVLLRDRFDIWKIALDGSEFENLTKVGRKLGIRFTLLRPRSPDDRSPPERTVDLSKPLLLGAENLDTRDTGFFRLDPGAAPKLLVMGARAYGTPVKANDADVYLLTVQTFSQYPDYYVTGPDFHELKRVTDINPHVKDYNWGTAELVKYTSTDGVPLTGVLIRPENFDPKKKYPMVVYIYERLSDGLHTFRVPNVVRGQVINPTFYASNGYLVLMPDIAYKVGEPGPSAMKCVLPAVQVVVDKGFVNEKAIGINGQSWGGYQIAYMITQTNRFKAAVAGAPVSNMVSAYDGIRWGTGLPRQFQYERSQSRIGGTPWDMPMRYIENSPIFHADKVQTPLLMIHNDQDDAVPWYQGIEYYLALRRLNKEVYLLNYNGEKHNLTKRSTARDFSVRMFQFFETHLKGKPAPEWMAKGVPFLERETEKEAIKKVLQGGK